MEPRGGAPRGGGERPASHSVSAARHRRAVGRRGRAPPPQMRASAQALLTAAYWSFGAGAGNVLFGALYDASGGDARPCYAVASLLMAAVALSAGRTSPNRRGAPLWRGGGGGCCGGGGATGGKSDGKPFQESFSRPGAPFTL